MLPDHCGQHSLSSPPAHLHGMLHELLKVTAYVDGGLLCSAMLVGEGGVGQHGYNSTESTSKLSWHS